MDRTVNQWLDWIDGLPAHVQKEKIIQQFKFKLKKIKFSKEYMEFGGKVKVSAPKKILDCIKVWMSKNYKNL